MSLKAVVTPLSPAAPHRQSLLRDYAWFILKNIIGWLLIVASLVLGPAIPGPGGIPLFLIGFALVSFPGKRRGTARVLRGRPFRRLARSYSLSAFGISLLLPAAGAMMLLWLTSPRLWLANHVSRPDIVTLELYLAAVLIFWLLLRLAPRGANLALPWMPRMRRRIRPWLRRHGIRLLPPRRRHRDEHGHIRYSEDILTLSDEWLVSLHRFWRRYRRWLLVLTFVSVSAGGWWISRLL